MPQKTRQVKPGDKFGEWTALGFSRRVMSGKSRRYLWHCMCSCGEKKEVDQANLVHGGSTMCLACAQERRKQHRIKPGDVFGQWEVLESVDRGRLANGSKRVYWKCRCSCGNEREVDQIGLAYGRSTRCVECAQASRKGKAVSHGYSDTSIYSIWRCMKNRCRNPKAHNYERYGGRGIDLCERWESFENFLADMGEPPTATHTLDRKDNNGNYEPGNCRWASKKSQSRNMRTNRLITCDGRTMCLSEWSEETGLNYMTIAARIDKYGWSVKDALTTPAAKTGRGASKN